MRPPEFWTTDAWPAPLLDPLGRVYAAAGRWRRRLTPSWHPPVPAICVGNLVAGGAGKTPVAIALARWLANRYRVAVISRGYGGRLRGPLRVDPTHHSAKDVGDEPLLLAAVAPTWIGRDRRAVILAATEAGADVVVLDDGLQNPTISPDLALAVIDGGFGFGNGRVIPAGPLREPAAEGLGRVEAVVLVGEDRAGASAGLSDRRVVRARLMPDEAALAWRGRRVYAFAGIGRPQKFFETLAEIGAEIAGSIEFPDHHPYSADDVMGLVERAAALTAQPITTRKDWVRLAPEARAMVEVVDVRLTWRDPSEIADVVDRTLARRIGHD
jgi:tetraacyldisaccharide 4'-kinase